MLEIWSLNSQRLIDMVARDVVQGRKHIALAISEPYAGRWFKPEKTNENFVISCVFQVMLPVFVPLLCATAIILLSMDKRNGLLVELWLVLLWLFFQKFKNLFSKYLIFLQDYFTTLVRTGDEGFGGLSVLLIERER